MLIVIFSDKFYLLMVQLAVSDLPFGGVGDSGMGCYHGKYSFEAFSHKKVVMYRSFNGDIPGRYPPYKSDDEQ